ncbi:SIS domain-containing protein [Acidithiobacillus thiooxidans]|uniref:SIS domain-containing protein n=1 Tax=Acidithiobacillus thiooxidans TaxID=930 RepID=UPI001C067C97|nr:SIS domain-containing protein [Acidithiobacillus thiooxidans]MBU2838318.1 SIS domain-containing protein [Acidithiobacillus thiooxidans]
MKIEDLFISQIMQAQQVSIDCLAKLPSELALAADLLIGALRMGCKVLTCGNGGSAGDAQHIASELVNRFETERMALAAISLVPDSSVVTSIANDYSYDVLFSRQVEAIGRPGDVLVAFSTSGNSNNVVRGIEAAHRRGMRVVALTGRDGGVIGKTMNAFDVEIRVPTQDTARIQEIHLLAIHALCKAIDTEFSTTTATEEICKVQRDWNRLVEYTRGLRPLVFTNGIFNILNRGHVHFLQTARAQGAYLVVGVNSDTSVKLLGNGADRRIQREDDLVDIIAGLGCVDFVTIFDEKTPARLIETLAPDVLVKRSDCELERLDGVAFVVERGGRVVTIPS